MSEKRMIRVLVFPSCNEPGMELVRSLIDQPNIEVHGGSIYAPDEDPSAYLLRHFTTFPALGQPGFREVLEDYIQRHGIGIVFPTMEELVCEFSQWAIHGVRFVASDPQVAAIARSKQKTYEALGDIVPVPAIYPDAVPGYPVYAKPRAGSGGRGHALVCNAEQLQWARGNDLLVCEYLPGREMVAYSLGDPDGRHLVCLTKTTGRWKGGSSHVGALCDDPVVKGHAAAIAARLRLVGPWFAQFRQDRSGVYRLMELNARLGGGSGICRLAGVNFSLLAARLFSGLPMDIPVPLTPICWVRSLGGHARTADFDRVIWDLAVFVRPADGKLRPAALAAMVDLANRGITQDCCGTEFPEPLVAWGVAGRFHSHFAGWSEALASVRQARRTVLVTDDLSPADDLSASCAGLRIVRAAGLDLLGAERIEMAWRDPGRCGTS